MSQSALYDAMSARAATYFSRPSFMSPSFVDDDTIVMLDDRSGTFQVSRLSLAKGQVTPLTSFPERVQSVKASKKSGAILFGMDAGGNERQQLYTLSLDGTHRRVTHNDDAIHDPGAMNKAGDYVLVRTNAREFATFDVVGQSLDGGEPEMWLQAGGQVQGADISPDGSRILVVRSNGNLDADVVLVEKEQEPRNLTTHDGEQWIYGAEFDADGTGAWLLSNLDRDRVALMHLDLETGQRTVVFEDSWDVESFKIAPDDGVIAVATNENGRSRMYLLPNGEGANPVEVEIPVGVIDGFSWSPDSSTVVFGFSSVEAPSVIMAAARDGSVSVIADADGDAPKTFVPEAVTYTSFDGLEIPAFFFKPEGDGPFPVLVDIHGGPEGQRKLEYRPSGPVLQYLTSLGMAVLSLNVRGSTGYGKEFTHLDDTYKRMDSVKDVEYAVKWLRERDDVIGDKIAVYGRSYGGFMVLACLVEYPELWAAGVEFVGIANFVSFLERTSEWRRKHREFEYGSLETDRDMLWEISPMRRIERVTAPLMVCHGRNDVRVPLFETEQVVEAVQKNGQDVLFRIYDDEGHAMTKLPNTLDAFAHMGEFLTKHLGLPDLA